MQTYRPETANQYRVRMPRAERRHPWLALLFDLYAIIDASVAAALAASGRQSACAAGCGVCCHQIIPATPLEVAGLSWYAREEMPKNILAALRGKRGGTMPRHGGPCRFLLGGSCGVYAVRPVACRRYVVLGAACGKGKDPSRTRPEDLLQPSREALNAAYAATLPYYAALGETVPGPENAFAFLSGRSVDLAACSAGILGLKG